MAAAAPASSDPQEGQAMARVEAEAAEASIRSLVPVKVETMVNVLELFRTESNFTFYCSYFYILTM